MTTSKTIRIGTRDSQLAMYQAFRVSDELTKLGYSTQIVPIKSLGDISLDKPLYEMGITGIFTKNLDLAMIKGQIDIAVHSMKDVPTRLPHGIVQAAVLERASVEDILVYKNSLNFLENSTATIATGSLRRKAQWLHKYPIHRVENLRGNVITRLQKLQENLHWNGAIFAKAGLERIQQLPENHCVLDWMTPAPAQGAIMVVAMENDEFSLQALQKINHKKTQICTEIERRFLRELEGGCTAPIGGFAQFVSESKIQFVGNLFSVCGTQKIEVTKQFNADEIEKIPERLAQEILNQGGREIINSLKITSTQK